MKKRLILAFFYCIAALACLQIDLGFTNASPIWIPAGIAVYCLNKWGLKYWQGVYIGAFSANVISFYLDGNPIGIAILTSAWIAVGNTTEAAVIALVLIVTNIDVLHISGWKSMKHYLYSVLLGCGFAAYNGAMAVATLITKTVSQFDVFLAWFSGDVMGVIVVTYILIILDNKWNRHRKSSPGAARSGLILP